MEFVIAAHALKIKLFGLFYAGRHGGYLACGPQARTLAGAGRGNLIVRLKIFKG